MHNLKGSAAIVGVGTAGVGLAPGKSHLELIAEASKIALDEAGLTMRDVDGLFTASLVNFFPTLTTAEYLGIRPAVTVGTNLGGASFEDYVIQAAMALKAGLCKVALICYGSNQRSASGRHTTMSDMPKYEAPYNPRFPIAAYALTAARHMYEFGTTREQLAEVALAARRWAQKNPEASERGELTMDDILSARMVCDPLSVRDCCLVTDGAGAIVMIAADRAKDVEKKPVYFLGGAAATWFRQISAAEDLTVTSATESGSRAYRMARLSPKDVDVVEVYDAFTINTILFLEDLGFCKKGEGGAFVSDGGIAPGGRLPVNTNGGGLSYAHPGMYGVFLLIEAARQLRGEAGERQIPDAEIALCHGNGGTLSAEVSVLLGTSSAL
jgi:acetyl-CoA acetyltransferase